MCFINITLRPKTLAAPVEKILTICINCCSVVPPVKSGEPICNTILATLIVLLMLSTAPVSGVEVTEIAGAAHGYPGFMDINGKKLADGEFHQWMEDDRLHIDITYQFASGELFEENALFRKPRPDAGTMVV
jgi:hypothetical protein